MGLTADDEPGLQPPWQPPPPDSDLLVSMFSPYASRHGARALSALKSGVDGPIRVALASLMGGRHPRLDAAILGEIRFPQVRRGWLVG